MKVANITRKIELDAGHRIPNHKSKCKNAHGHRYVLECTVRGIVKEARNESDDGMVIDFGDLKAVMMTEIHDKWDHGFLVWRGDQHMLDALDKLGYEHKTVVLNDPPTVENLVHECYQILSKALEGSGLLLVAVTLYETPNCWATFPPTSPEY